MQDRSGYETAPRLIAVAHGTASAAGSDTTARLFEAIRAARPDVPAQLCFLDVVGPRLADVLDDQPAVVVPLLLSTGYHVRQDIPAAVAAYPNTRVARHLGPHPLLVDVLEERLGAFGVGHVVLVGAGSRYAETREELEEMADQLDARIGEDVLSCTLADNVRGELMVEYPVRVATYLLAEGQFLDDLRAAASGLGSVAEPLGAHPSLVRLVWERYDEALR